MLHCHSVTGVWLIIPSLSYTVHATSVSELLYPCYVTLRYVTRILSPRNIRLRVPGLLAASLSV